MIWAAFTLAFFGCLRAGELTVQSSFDPNVNLCRKDVTITRLDNRSVMTVRIKRSKTDRLNTGFDVVVSCVPHVACSVCAMSSYIKCNQWSDNSQPLFQIPNGTMLTKSLFRKQLALYMGALHYPPHLHSAHSFRSGCASEAAAAGFLDWEIKLLGRWASDAYQGYIRAPKQLLANFSKRIVNNATQSHSHPHHFVNNAML